MPGQKPKILVALDSMKNANTGYFYFGKGLGDALIRNNYNKFDLSFYLHRRTTYIFNSKVPIVWLSKLHRWFFPYKNKFDLVHFTDQDCRLNAGKISGIKVMTIHDLNRLHTDAKASKDTVAYMKRLKKLVDVMHRVVAISDFVAQDVKKHFPGIESKLSVIYNGTDKPQLVERHKPLIMVNGEFLFTIGMLLPHKGFQYLPCLLEGNNLNLVIAGIETPHKQAIIAEAKKYHCENRLVFTGPVSDPDKAWYYANCKAFVFPSTAEGFGLPVIEAMHFGKPVFLARRTSLPEIGGDVAYYFDTFKPADMQAVLKSGLDYFERNKRSQELIARAQKFSWDGAAKAYLQLYQNCLNNE